MMGLAVDGQGVYVNVSHIHKEVAVTACSLSVPRPGFAVPVPAIWPVVATVLAFILWWPLGLAALAAWRIGARLGFWPGRPWGRGHHSVTLPMRFGGSGNSAFDGHRAETLWRLEEERRALDRQQEEFAAFLDELRLAKDREEFDRFMAGRRGGAPQG